MIKVFVVDDSTVVRERLRELLGEMKNVERVIEATNAAEAYQMLADFTPDLVILDIYMPGGSGMSVLKELRKREKPPVTMVFTSYAFPQYKEAYLKAGADYFFDKTGDLPEMLEIINGMSKN